jgi:DNA repair protein RecN (Recombination protein N)
MLTQLYISNLVTIQELQLEFCAGTTVITGETGAGKSILIDAIELALGARANGDVVRQGQEKADISLSFDISKCSEAHAWLRHYDLDQANECVIRRTIHRDGKSRSYINGMPTTLQPLREFSELLIQIHGQHEHQSLLKSDAQRTMLDRYAGHQQFVDKVHVLAHEWQTLSNEIIALRKLSAERVNRSDFLKFQLDELEVLHLTQDEFHSLDLEHKQLANAGDLLQNINYALGCLTDDEDKNALHLLNQALQALETIQRVDPKITTWIESIKNAIIQVSDAEDELRRYLDVVDLDPERLQWLEDRITKIFDLARKHRIAPNELYELQQKLTAEFSELATSDERLLEMAKKLENIEKEYLAVANQLSKSRAQAAKKLNQEITRLIHELSLSQGEFNIHFEKIEPAQIAVNGLEKITFQIKTNAGQMLQPLAKIASGGELSRISLAIHVATAAQHTVPALIFDEVDVGIGGGTAEIVGKLLRRLGESHQVLCITHAPQVAAQGHQHLLVAKIQEKASSHTHINYLKPKDKIQELARMLGGVEITKKTLEHAREMVEKV